MTLGSFEVVFFTVGFLVPGFVWSAVLSMIVPRRAELPQIRALEYLTLSCINHGIWSWAIYWMFATDWPSEHPFLPGMCFGGIIFLSPIVLGLLTGYLRQKEAMVGFFRSLGLRTIHFIPQAWDWHFSRQKPYWVVVTLKDGSNIYGLYHSRSFASSDADRRDLYLEAQFQPVADTGDWAPIEDTSGVLIMGDQITAIEFRKVFEADHEQE